MTMRAREPAPVPAADLRGLRALIVDDNEVNRRVLHERLTSWGMRSGSLSSGDRVPDSLRGAKESGDPYHFVLLDYQMPGMDGVEVAGAIQADPAIRDTLVVLLTSVRWPPFGPRGWKLSGRWAVPHRHVALFVWTPNWPASLPGFPSGFWLPSDFYGLSDA